MDEWEKKLMIKSSGLEDWEQTHAAKLTSEIKELLITKNKLLENLKNIKDLSGKYSAFWNLKENFEQLKHKFISLQIWTRVKFEKEIDFYLCCEIYYFELCFSMLKEKYGAKNVDLRHFLNATQIEYEYFIKKNYKLPDHFINAGFELEGVSNIPKLNLVINNIRNAQANLEILLEQDEKKQNHKDLFLYYEVMGDLYIHIYLLLKGLRDIDFQKLDENLRSAYYYYYRSVENKKIFMEKEGDYRTHYDGLHGWPCLGIFVDFYNNMGVSNVHDVRLKLKQLNLNKFLQNGENDAIKKKAEEDVIGGKQRA
jgi:hypothetical protein